MPVRYFDGTTDVALGDRVSIRIWFKIRKGRVVYVPGVSASNSEFEYNGMRWVGIRLENGTLVATPVLSATNSLKRKMRFITRDNSTDDLIGPSSKEFEERGEGPAL